MIEDLLSDCRKKQVMTEVLCKALSLYINNLTHEDVVEYHMAIALLTNLTEDSSDIEAKKTTAQQDKNSAYRCPYEGGETEMLCGDGFPLRSIAHPENPDVFVPEDISDDALETIEMEFEDDPNDGRPPEYQENDDN